ncbi:hypothetical protein SAMN06893096_11613 [Geodermatophilus pulveris]|uniref:Uncharacterized protein n=1 Tax=Geodermatophilus pulveris TaxID=1564159 RepID=A0A239JKB3_9ACTN|nr:hypothetical protein [Geodermatophilus pulveris]SNT06476.1 hypothetical protein SAMN06893096_11613 [Geodermatophilus pulveris]
MSAPSASLLRFSRSTDEGLGLLMDLYSAEAPAPRRAGTHRAELRGHLDSWLRRAADWGAGPGGAWRAW